MTARPLPTLLTALCCLLALATSAAECAWVLWGQTVDPWNALAFLSLGGWSSKDACEQERARREQTPIALRMAAYICLPDTEDPRGAKEE